MRRRAWAYALTNAPIYCPRGSTQSSRGTPSAGFRARSTWIDLSIGPRDHTRLQR
jgi:hypothetical protein